MTVTCAEGSQAAAPAEAPIDGIERRRRMLGLPPLTPEAHLALEWALSQQTPGALRLQRLLEFGEQLGSLELPSADLDAWGEALARIDALAYGARLIEAQIIAGNTGIGIMLPDRTLDIEDC